MPIVSNTSPLLNLAIIGHISLLQQQFGEIWIPQAVAQELRAEQDLPGSQVVREVMATGWLRVKEAQDRALIKSLQRDLDAGEAEAITLALQVKAERVLLDERDGRRIAKSLGLNVTGVLGILLRAKREGHLSSLQETIAQLRDKAGLRVGAELLADILQGGDEA